MNVLPTDLPGVLVLEPRVFADSRGFFLETYHQARYREAGIECEFVQDNFSQSRYGALRGLHYQIRHPQAKLVHAIRGEIFDVAVDLRRGSPTFGRWTGAMLNEENRRQFFVPAGFAHGFCVLSETAEVAYKCSEFYYPEHERTLLWNDPELNIGWPIREGLLLSEKDRLGKPLAEAETFE